MKKLNKLQIKAEKLLKNEELLTLRGGYGPGGAMACYLGTTGGGNVFLYCGDCSYHAMTTSGSSRCG
jgi:hypothetical protein